MDHLQKKDLQEVIAHTERLLANLNIYYQNLKNFHWNLTGPHFVELHKHLEGLYEVTAERIDEVAERLRALNVPVWHSLQDYVKSADFKEATAAKDAWQMIATARDNNEQLIQNLETIVVAADKAGDAGSSDLFATYIRELEKEAWMLNALLAR